MTGSVVHDDVGFSGSVPFESPPRSADAALEIADRHGPNGTPAFVMNERHAGANLNDGRLLNVGRKLFWSLVKHTRLLISGPSRVAHRSTSITHVNLVTAFIARCATAGCQMRLTATAGVM